MENDKIKDTDFDSLMKTLGGFAAAATGAYIVKILKDHPESLEKITSSFLNFFNNSNNRLD